MKITTRDAWRVTFTLKPRTLGEIGLDGLDALAGQLLTEGPLELAVLPRSLGDFGFIKMSPARVSGDIEGDYRRRCDEIAAALGQHRQVDDVEVHCTETHTCSHCHLAWEVMTPEYLADRDLWQDEHTVEGEPVCCEKAIAEFRTERGIPALSTRAGAR